MNVEIISASLAPGVALTSSIFYATSLAQRFTVTTARIRDLNKEARTLDDNPRKDSVRKQVGLLHQRTRIIHRALLLAYSGMLAFAVTMLMLLGVGALSLKAGIGLAIGLFAVGLGLMVSAVVTSFRELTLSERTIAEDISSTFP